MLIIMPYIIKKFGVPDIVAGAWLGGALDTTASVTAATQLVGPLAIKAGVIVKFSQNVLIGVAAIFIAAWWTLKKDPSVKTATDSKALAFVGAQLFNIVWTLLWSYLLFGGILFPVPNIK